jgi:hypothetical protein
MTGIEPRDPIVHFEKRDCRVGDRFRNRRIGLGRAEADRPLEAECRLQGITAGRCGEGDFVYRFMTRAVISPSASHAHN